MGKLGCRCGHVIVDQTDFLPYKAEVLSDQDSGRVWDDTSAAAAEYAALRTAEERRRWIAAYFNEHYPSDMTDAEVIHDILVGGMLRHGRTLYECQACGRLWLQARPDENRFISYAPDEPGGTGVLQSDAGPPAGRDALPGNEVRPA